MSKSPKKQETLPASMLKRVPSAVEMAAAVTAFDSHIDELEKELKSILPGSSVDLARAFVVMRRLDEKLDEACKRFGKIFERYKVEIVPDALEQEGLKNISLEEGYRITTSVRWTASIVPDQREAAFKWLRENQLGALITETVNASTLASTARTRIEDENLDLPPSLFNVGHVLGTSVTAVK